MKRRRLKRLPPPPVRRLHPDGWERGVWWGPLFLRPVDDHRAEKTGPAARIYGRWMPALRASRALYMSRRINPTRKDRQRIQEHRLWVLAERINAARWDAFPF